MQPATSAKHRAVNPVLSTAILVVVVMVVSSLVGSLVLGVSGTAEPATASDANFTFDAGSVVHTDGIELPASDIKIRGDIESDAITWGTYGRVSPGDNVAVTPSSSRGTIYVVYDDGTGRQIVLARLET